MSSAGETTLDGGCVCGALRYRMTAEPMMVHCCHCSWCQRETGSAFAINAMVEADRVELLAGQPELVEVPSASGKGQTIARCPVCRVALWSTYAGAGEAVRFIRVGTLDEPARVPPQIHIFTSTKQPWVAIPPDLPAFEAFYDPGQQWPEESLARYAAAQG